MMRNLGINAKFTLITLAAVQLSLLIAGAAELMYLHHRSYQTDREELTVLASVIADRTAAAIVFNDPDTATENLAALAARSTIVSACVIDKNSKLFASYQRSPASVPCLPARGEDVIEALADYIYVVRGIQVDGARVGEIHIRADLSELRERLHRILLFVVLIDIGVTLGVIIVLQRLQRWVTQPILHLSERARTVAREKDYSVRAEKLSHDELGVLVDAFNGMLETIERQNRTLMENNLRLESIVSKRSAELRDAQVNLLRQERLATLGQLTGTVSHELRNPLGTIQTSVDVLRQRLDTCPKDLERTLERIVRNIHRCENIINELLDYSRGSRPHLQTVHIDAWLDDILIPYRTNPDVRIEAEIPAGLVCELDPERLRRAVINVIDNAIHALTESERRSHTDQPRIRIRVHKDTERLVIAIEDNGPGIPDAVLERIFEPLFSTRAFGVGLGLAIVQQILEQHAGGVEVSSNEQLGTRVSLWLPLTHKSMQTAESTHAPD